MVIIGTVGLALHSIIYCSFIHLTFFFVHLFKYLLRVHCVPGTLQKLLRAQQQAKTDTVRSLVHYQGAHWPVAASLDNYFSFVYPFIIHVHLPVPIVNYRLVKHFSTFGGEAYYLISMI